MNKVSCLTCRSGYLNFNETQQVAVCLQQCFDGKFANENTQKCQSKKGLFLFKKRCLYCVILFEYSPKNVMLLVRFVWVRTYLNVVDAKRAITLMSFKARVYGVLTIVCFVV